MSQAKPEKEMRFIRIVIMIVTNVSLNTRKNVDNVDIINTTGTIQLIGCSTKHYQQSRLYCIKDNFHISYHYIVTLTPIIHQQWSDLLLFSFNNNKWDFKMTISLPLPTGVCKWMILNLIKIQLLIGHILTKSVPGHSGLEQ